MMRLLVALALLAGAAKSFRLPMTFPSHGLSSLRRLLQPTDPVVAAGQQFPATLASCQWSDAYPAKCTLSAAVIFATNASTLNASAYPARAFAFLQAANTHCNTFTQSQCTWPCQWDNLASCHLADQPRLTVWDCPDSQARTYYTCPETPRLTRAWCLATPGCSYVPQPTSGATAGLRTCEASFYVNMTAGQRLDFGGPAYFVRMPREILGCCKGSTYRYIRSNLCKPGELSSDECNAIQGCRWGTDGSCKPTPEQVVALQFADAPSDPFNAVLQATAEECDAITTASACNVYKPLAIDAQKVMAYLDQDLDSINTPISNDMCVLPSLGTGSM